MPNRRLFVLLSLLTIVHSRAAAQTKTFEALSLQLQLRDTLLNDATLARQIRDSSCVNFIPTKRRVDSLLAIRNVSAELEEAIRQPCLVGVKINERSRTEEITVLLETQRDKAADYIDRFLERCPMDLTADSLRQLNKRRLKPREFRNIATRCDIHYLGPRVSVAVDLGLSPLQSGGAMKDEGFRFQGKDFAVVRVSVRAYEELHLTLSAGRTPMDHDNPGLDVDAGGAFDFDELGGSARWMFLCRFGRICGSPVARRFEPFVEGAISLVWLRGQVEGEASEPTDMRISGRMYAARFGIMAYAVRRLTIAGFGGVSLVDFTKMHISLPGPDIDDQISAWSVRPQIGLQFMVNK